MCSRRWSLLLLVAAACGGDPKGERSAESPADSEVRRRLLAAMREADDAAPVVVDDETPRMEVPDKPGEGVILAYFRGASVQVPTEGLESVEMALSENGLALTLRCSDSLVRVQDRSGSPSASAAYPRFLAAGLGLRDRLWPGGPGEDGRALHRRLGRVESRFRERFAEKARESFQLTRFALRATAKDAEEDDLEDLFGRWQMLEVKRRILEDLGEAGGLSLEPLAAGPTLGVLRGLPGRDARVVGRIEGPDGMLVLVHVEGAGGQPVPARWNGFLASLRPFATNDVSPSQFERTGASHSAPVSALHCLSALFLSPNLERGLRLLRALREAGPEVSDADLAGFAESLASLLRMSPAETDRLRRFPEGD